MTVAAIGGDDDMVGVFAAGSSAVVARHAGAQHLRMVDVGRRFPRGNRMTRLTAIGSIDVGGVFAGRAHAVVATDAIYGNAGVVETGRFPRNSRVAIVAFGGGDDVVGMFPGRRRAVVARRTTAQHLRMIHRRYRFPHAGTGMACFAVVAGLNVRRVLAGGFVAVVAADAVGGDAGVIEQCGSPSRRTVARVASVGAWDVRKTFAGRYRAVVTTDASA